ncbi:uncharacterized protein A4U43_UnF6650 [Asparagus officinalis]|uniref:Uncharacterized protein n=1 Tax=Asparagus officinalis TaxID=4686 RepID=A0A1R3L6F0_ASPOF|nr:uncharacterized protein A4U43_UnF6650 [Asparagus officinalis]
MDEVLASVAETIKNFAVIYLVDITEVPDFNTMYELYDPSTVMFFFRNKHIMIDLGTGNNNKINWAMKDKQEFIDIVETVFRGARKGRAVQLIYRKDLVLKAPSALFTRNQHVADHFKNQQSSICSCSSPLSKMAREEARLYATEVAPKKLAFIGKNKGIKILETIEEEDMEELGGFLLSLGRILFLAFGWRMKLKLR